MDTPVTTHDDSADLTEASGVVGAEEVSGIIDNNPDTNPTADTEFEPDDGDESEEHSGLRWHISDTANPFSAELVFTDGGETALAWQLDPLTLREVITALTQLQAEQVAVLTGVPIADALPALATTATKTPTRRPVTATANGSWWARHKIFTALVVIVALCFLYGLISGGAQM